MVVFVEYRSPRIAVADAKPWAFAKLVRVDKTELLRAGPVGHHQRGGSQCSCRVALALRRDSKTRDDKALAHHRGCPPLAEWRRNEIGQWRIGKLDQRDVRGIGGGCELWMGSDAYDLLDDRAASLERDEAILAVRQ